MNRVDFSEGTRHNNKGNRVNRKNNKVRQTLKVKV